MNAIDIINKTKRKALLTEDEIKWLVNAYTSGNIPDHQMSAWLMAVCLNGLTDVETLWLTYAMRDSGDILKLDIGMCADKHSTGGVGDKTTLIIGPVAAACGVCVAKMSGRGLGHTGGTIDKLESIPGFRAELTTAEFTDILKKNKFAVTSQSSDLCPADKKIYALRNSSGTVDSIPLICASIMSKKLATNADVLVLDVKYGSGAFMKTYDDAVKLAELMEKTGELAGMKCRAAVTDMNAPLGHNIGNALEVEEAVAVLRGEDKGRLYEVCIELAADILELSEKGTNEECRRLAEDSISSGQALEVFRKTVELQGGDPKICDDTSLLPHARYSYAIKAPTDIMIKGFDCEELGMVSVLLGAGRLTKEESLDMTAGIVVNKEIGDHLAAGETIMTLYSTKCRDFSDAAVRALNAVFYKTVDKK